MSAGMAGAAQGGGLATTGGGDALLGGGATGESSGLTEALRPQVRLGLEEEYNDNIFLTPSGEEEDYITRTSLSFTWGHRTPIWTASISYRPSYVYYSRHNDESELTHLATAEGNLILVRDLIYFEARDTYSRVALTSRRDRTEVSSFVDQTDQNVLLLHPYVRRSISPTLLLEAGYEYTNTTYTKSEGTDRQSHGANALMSKTFTPHFSGALLYRYRSDDVDSDDFSDFVRHEGGVGLDYHAGNLLTVSAEGGISHIDVSHDFSKTEAFYRAELFYRPPPFVFSYSYGQRFETSVEEGIFLSRKHELGMAYERRLSVRLTFFQAREDYKELPRDDLSRGMRVEVDYPLVQTVAFHVGGEWRRGDYDPEDERVIERSTNTSITWTTSRYITLAGGYRFIDSNSNMDTNDFQNNSAFVRAEARF